MTRSQADGPEASAEALIAEIRALHLRQGKLSSRRVALLAEKANLPISHTTVATLLKGEKLPKWEILQRFVVALGGDEERFLQLWVEATERADEKLAGRERAPQSHAAPGKDAAPGKQAAFAALPAHRTTTGNAPTNRVETELVDPDTSAGLALSMLWSLGYREHDAPPAIQLIMTALRHNRNIPQLVGQIIPSAPREAAPIIALIAVSSVSHAARIVADIARLDDSLDARLEQSRVPPLLAEVVVTSPREAATLVESLLDEYDVKPALLAEAAVRACVGQPDYHPLRRRILGAAVAAGRESVEYVAKRMANMVIDDLKVASTIGQALGDALVQQVTRSHAARLLHSIAKVHMPVGIDLFYVMIRLGHDGDRSPLSILAEHLPNGCPVLLLECARGNGLAGRTAVDRTPARVGHVVVTLASEDADAAISLVARMATRHPHTVVRMLAGVRELDLAAQLLVALAVDHVQEAAQVLAAWMSSHYPANDIVRSMAHEDAGATVQVVATAAVMSLSGFPRRGVRPLAGIDKGFDRWLRDTLRAHANHAQWTLIKPLL